jgi:hypothetical protein
MRLARRFAGPIVSVAAVAVSVPALAGDLVGDHVPAFCTWQNVVNRPPQIAEPVFEGDSAIRIHDQVAGGSLDIFSTTWGVQQLGVPTQNASLFNLAASATAGDRLYACQSGGIGPVQCSPWITVQPRPATLSPPVLQHLVLRGASAVTVSGVHPGAEVWIESNGVEIGRRWAGPDTSVSVPIPGNLAAFAPLTVRQEIDSVVSGSVGTVVWPLSPGVAVPRVAGPVVSGDAAVWVVSITPGSLVEVVDVASGSVLGAAHVGETIAKVATCPVTGSVQARVTRDGQVATSAVRPLSVMTGGHGLASETDFDYGLDATSGLQMKGRLYLPTGTVASNPVVFLVHGNQPTNSCDVPGVGHSTLGADDSYVGYGYLAYELIAKGFLVYSLEIPRDTLPDARARLLLATVDEALARRAELDGDSPVGFFGHSLGGSAVIYARSIADPGLELRAVVSVAPTTQSLSYADFDPATGPSAPLLHVYGADDYFFFQGGCTLGDILCSLRQYDAAWGAKSQLFVANAGHNEFNTCWGLADTDGRLSMDDHQRILAAYAVPFLYGLLTGAGAEFAPYFEGSVRPKGMYHFGLSMQHHRPGGLVVVDSFGDAPAETPFPYDNTDEFLNSQGGAVSQTIGPRATLGIREDAQEALQPTVSYQHAHEPTARVLLLTWDSIGHQYVSELPTPVAAAPNGVVSFRVMAVGGDAANDVDGVEGHPFDLMVELSDGTNTAKVRAGSAGPLLYPFAGEDGSYRQVFRTVRLPMSSFTTVAPGLDITALRTVRIGGRVRSLGRLVIDDLEIGR